ncbi:hypothetical protein NMY22_g17727 [Coprinellus aureogranulatus]|nr:hypothetical protein NMY22_g17727 [Coprinellus aureogranulatus]
MDISKPESPPIRERSEQFYYDDGTLFLLAVDEKGEKEKVYCLHPSLLRQRSGMLNDMLTLPPMPGPGNAMEGSAEDFPIRLPSPKFIIRKFDNLLVYMFTGPSDYPKCDVFHFDLLDLGHYLDMPDAIQYVIEAFEKQERDGVFHPPLKFRLARTYGILQWVEPAVRAMLGWPGTRFTEEDAHEVGFDVYCLMLSTKFKVDDVRKVLAYNAPPLVTGDNCLTPGACKSGWVDAWWTALAPHILHPSWPTVGDRIKYYLEAKKNIPGVCEGCYRKTVESMRGDGTFERDSNLVEECVSRIKEICGDNISAD